MTWTSQDRATINWIVATICVPWVWDVELRKPCIDWWYNTFKHGKGSSSYDADKYPHYQISPECERYIVLYDVLAIGADGSARNGTQTRWFALFHLKDGGDLEVVVGVEKGNWNREIPASQVLEHSKILFNLNWAEFGYWKGGGWIMVCLNAAHFVELSREVIWQACKLLTYPVHLKGRVSCLHIHTHLATFLHTYREVSCVVTHRRNSRKVESWNYSA